ncbi:TetR/AcrR family transcriptional regulator [Streptomonospora wellingtoniae]|uniref:Helix-turn-helix domain-containing protein n=1 Tax=Streptomonospora wellingtoniae TaxID=3075544 RepID=A0ABU2KN99_9ACTN|nr:helix-turn-helix domain-containing protein [Streptomonospora sp. DSM 45055]MDT0300749.1 helix-turn-helix domain-containing protein [Streptomonospora sp. DSM 45055]
MARRTGTRAGGREGAWQWSRTAHTRRVLLEAAREVFSAKGFADAGVADVVERAGSSVGSLYHHFGGKTELFLALWEDQQAADEEQAATAVARARAGGEDDPLELFIAGARAFLEGSWQRRDVGLLLLAGDGPPGFDMLRRGRNREWARQNSALLQAGDSALERLTVGVFTAVIGEARREIVVADSRDEADRLIDAAIDLIRRLDR